MAKQHFDFLDGLRGVAALTIAVLHASQSFKLGFIPSHASLAVDFFFCLSGFVVAYAYDSRLAAGMTLGDFALRRVIRLYPMILVGIVLGFLVTTVAIHIGVHDMNIGVLFTVATGEVFMLPMGLWFSQSAFYMNNPLWSLFFELCANFIYGLDRKFRMTNKAVYVPLVIVSGAALVLTAYSAAGLEYVGFSNTRSFMLGFVRVIYPFFVGILIFRLRLYMRVGVVPRWLLLAALLTLFLLPGLMRSWLYDSLCVIVLFPLIITFGAGARGDARWDRAWTFLGKLSYPLYALHQPLVRGLAQLHARYLDGQIPASLAALASVLLSGLLAYAMFSLYDQPIRRWLTKTLQPRVVTRKEPQRVM